MDFLKVEQFLFAGQTSALLQCFLQMFTCSRPLCWKRRKQFAWVGDPMQSLRWQGKGEREKGRRCLSFARSGKSAVPSLSLLLLSVMENMPNGSDGEEPDSSGSPRFLRLRTPKTRKSSYSPFFRPFSIVIIRSLVFVKHYRQGSTAMSVRAVKVSNISLSASEQDIREFFSFSGEIDYIEMQSGDERSQVAYVTFKKSDGAETALLLSGATIVDMTVTIILAADYEPPAVAPIPSMSKDSPASGSESTIQKAENVISTALAKGLMLGKDVLDRAKTFDEKHQLTSAALTSVSSFDQKTRLSETISTGASAVNQKVLEMDNRYQVSEKARSAIAAAEHTLSNAGSAAMENKYVFAGVSWMVGAINKVAKTASEVGSKAVEKAAAKEQQRKPSEDDEAEGLLSVTPLASSSDHPKKPEPVRGLIL